MEIIYGIASFHRPLCKTYKFLRKIGVDNRRIIISLNDPKDYERYEEANPGANIIVCNGNSAASNRNNILKKVQGKCILLDDDIYSIKIYEQRQKQYGVYRTGNAKTLEEIFTECFIDAEKNKAAIFGINATSNGIITKRRIDTWGSYTPDVMIQGTLVGVVDPNIRFDESFLMVEDYELSCRVISIGAHTLRANTICAEKPKNGTNEGGLHERYENGELPYWIDKLCNKYPSIVRPNKKREGVIMKL